MFVIVRGSRVFSNPVTYTILASIDAALCIAWHSYNYMASAHYADQFWMTGSHPMSHRVMQVNNCDPTIR